VWAQTRTLNGSVRDAQSNEAVAGAIVTVRGTDNSTFVETDGKFVLSDVPAGEIVLVIDSPGHGKREVRVAPNQDNVNITMTLQVSEVITIKTRAPQIVRTHLQNGSSVVRGEDVNRVAPQTVETALSGKVAGANIQSNSGAPGGGIQMRLRGVSTITGQSDPLFVIDGVIVSNVSIPNGISVVTASAAGSNATNTQDNQVNRISDLNPEDIESVEILKGASASALYGSKASNGVVIITTKRGRGGQRTTASVTQRLGAYQLSNTLGSRRFEDVEEAVAAFGEGARDVYSSQPFDQEDLLASNGGVASETSANLAGSAGQTSFNASVTVRQDPGIIDNTGYEKQTGRLTLDHDFGRLKVSASAHLLHTDASRSITNNDNAGVSHYMVLPFTPSFLDLRQRADGSFPRNPFIGSEANPLQTAFLMRDNENVWRMIGSVSANATIYEEGAHRLSLIGTAGVDRFQQKADLVFPPELFFEDDDGLPGTSIDANAEVRNLNVDSSVVYNFRPQRGAFSSATTLGFKYEDRDLDTVYVTSRNLSGGQSNLDAGTLIDVTELRQRTKDSGFYAQEEVLLLNDSLSLLAAINLEQSSTFSDTGTFYAFPKFAATYAIPGLPRQVELLRGRAAYGESGNQPRFGQKFIPLTATTNVEGNPGIEIAGVKGSDNLKPERQREIEVGVDAVGFDGRAVVELSLYQKSITDLLLTRTTGPSTGIVQEVLNAGSLRNRGVELMVQVIPVQIGGFEWTARTTFALNRATITDLPDEIFCPPGSPEDCVPFFDTGGFGASLGTFRIQEGESATQIVGNNGRDPNTNARVVEAIGNTEPDFRVGFLQSFTWKGLGLTFFLDWQQGSDVINLTKFLYDLGANTADYDEPTGMVDDEGMPITVGQARLARQSDFANAYLEDATYLKLREIELFYNLPPSILKYAGPMKSARISLAARNLFTITDYSGLDPEVSNFGNQPIARNIDVAPFPPSRSFWFSVTAGF
jgi:TonB-linked SusC/RagA family outer membrane protein